MSWYESLIETKERELWTRPKPNPIEEKEENMVSATDERMVFPGRYVAIPAPTVDECRCFGQPRITFEIADQTYHVASFDVQSDIPIADQTYYVVSFDVQSDIPIESAWKSDERLESKSMQASILMCLTHSTVIRLSDLVLKEMFYQPLTIRLYNGRRIEKEYIFNANLRSMDVSSSKLLIGTSWSLLDGERIR